MTFGPIGIAPPFKRQGYGKRLLDYSMEKAGEMGAGALAITGNILFYGKSGFVPAKTKGVRYEDGPDADYFLIKELVPGFLNGVSVHTRIRTAILYANAIPRTLKGSKPHFCRNRS